MKRNLIFLGAMLLFITVAAQKNLTIEETVLRRSQLMPASLPQLQWIANTNTYSWVRTIDANEELVSSSGDGKKVKVIVSLTQLNDLLTREKEFSALRAFPEITWLDASQFSFEANLSEVIYNVRSKSITTKKLQLFPGGAGGHDTSSTGTMTAFTLLNNLFIMKNGEQIQVTHDTDPGIVNGSAVHRNEWGIHKGTFWSPSGKLLAFYRMDETMVTEYPIMELGSLPAATRMIRYPMAGGKSHHVTLGVYNTETGKTIFLKTGEPAEQYLTNIAWSPDNKDIYIAVLNRDQNHLQLNRYSAETGEWEATLFEEKDEEWVQPFYTMQFVPGHDDQFVWQSERDGFNALYLYQTDGKLIRQLTPTRAVKIMLTPFTEAGLRPMIVTELYGFDKKGTIVYFQAAPASSSNRLICSVELSKGLSAVEYISPVSGVCNAKFSDDHSQFICNYSDVVTPRITTVYKSTGKELGVINRARNPLEGYNQCEVKLFMITSADGTTPLWCRMLLPPGFDSTKKYPSLTYVYNGPNVQLITNTWLGGADLFLYHMAQQGFVVFTVDGRGSDNRGSDFEQAIFRHLGTAEIADQKKGSDYLQSKSWIDASRMAVYGWSYGGFMTTSMMTRNPGIYRCGVAGGPVIDWSYYEVMYTERYMDTPKSNPEGYKESNTMNYVQNLKGKLLLIHGTSDDVVVWQHSLAYTKAAVDKGVQTDYYVYPGHLHNVRGRDRVHLLTKVADYVITHTR